MFDPLRIGYVVEGKTDFIVLDAVVETFLGGRDYISRQIQPPLSDYAGDQGALGGGWKGVLQWCYNQVVDENGIIQGLAFVNYDYLIIHVDADIANENCLLAFDLRAQSGLPSDTCNNIRSLVVALLGIEAFPQQLMITVPAQCTEAWVFSALYPNEVDRYQPIETRPEVERLLIGKPERLVHNKDGAAKKQSDKYRNQTRRIAANWHYATEKCAEAKLFEDNIRITIA